MQCSVTNPESGETETAEVSGGERAELLLVPEEQASDGQTGSSCEIVKDAFAVYDIPVFIMVELMQDEELRSKIQEDSGLDIPDGTTPQGYIGIGQQYLENGRYEDAADILTTAIELDSEQEEAYVLRGNAYVRCGDTEEYLTAAQADYEAAIALDDSDAQAYLGLADVQIRQGEYDQALETLQQNLEKSGNDERIVEKITEMESGRITDSSHRTRLTRTYDESGLVWQQEFIYDGYDIIRTVAYDAAGAEKGAVNVLYDEEGRCIQNWALEGNDGTLLRMTYKYDGSNNPVESDVYDLDGTLSTHHVYEFDENGNEVRKETFYADGTSLGYQTLEYDAYGMLIKESHYSAAGTLDNSIVTEYDDRHHATKHVGYDSEGNIYFTTTIVNEYDDEGKLIRITYYDEEGNMTHYVEY